MKKLMLIIFALMLNSTLFWYIYFNNIYDLINLYRNVIYFNNYEHLFSLMIFVLIIELIVMVLYAVSKVKTKEIIILFSVVVFNIICSQYPILFFRESNVKTKDLYYHIEERFKNKDDLLNPAMYKKEINEKYELSLNIFKEKNNADILEEKIQKFYLTSYNNVNLYEQFEQPYDMEKIYTFNDLEIELNNIKNFKDCKKITTQEMFYFCTKYNIPAEVKYKIYLNNLNFTHIYNKKTFDKKFHQSVILNNFVHYSEALSNVDTNKMTVEEKNKDKEYRNEIKKCLLSMENLNNIIIMRTVDNTIIINSRFGHQSEMFKDPENAPILSIHND